MGCNTYKLFAYLFVVVITMPFLVYAEQYYDPVTRRYIDSAPLQRKPIVTNQVLLPTQAEIEAEKIRIQQEQLAQQQMQQRQATESSGMQARRRFDPNRYHRTEDIIISP